MDRRPNTRQVQWFLENHASAQNLVGRILQNWGDGRVTLVCRCSHGNSVSHPSHIAIANRLLKPNALRHFKPKVAALGRPGLQSNLPQIGGRRALTREAASPGQ